MTRVRLTFGIASAAFLATHSLLCFAKENESELPLAAKAVKEFFCVDDGLPSVETKQEAISLHHQLQNLFIKGDCGVVYLKNFTKKTSILGSCDSFVKTLGMEYNSNQDHFRFSSTELSIEE